MSLRISPDLSVRNLKYVGKIGLSECEGAISICIISPYFSPSARRQCEIGKCEYLFNFFCNCFRLRWYRLKGARGNVRCFAFVLRTKLPPSTRIAISISCSTLFTATKIEHNFGGRTKHTQQGYRSTRCTDTIRRHRNTNSQKYSFFGGKERGTNDHIVSMFRVTKTEKQKAMRKTSIRKKKIKRWKTSENFLLVKHILCSGARRERSVFSCIASTVWHML